MLICTFVLLQLFKNNLYNHLYLNQTFNFICTLTGAIYVLIKCLVVYSFICYLTLEHNRLLEQIIITVASSILLSCICCKSATRILCLR